MHETENCSFKKNKYVISSENNCPLFVVRRRKDFMEDFTSPFNVKVPDTSEKNSFSEPFSPGNTGLNVKSLEKYSSPFFNTVWSYTPYVWSKEDWKIVGSKKRSNSVCEPFINRKSDEHRKMSEVYSEEPIFGEAFYLTTSKKFENMSVNDIITFLNETLYVIEFNSGRMDISYMPDNNDRISYEVGNFVIIEADRGEDCGKILSITCKNKYRKLLNKMNEVTKEVQPKRIFRKAMRRDMEVMKEKHKAEDLALEDCRKRVLDKELEMEIVGCEYQWDFNKLTFYFRSIKRVDFRELVKELYKIYKTRIWMCAVEKSKNCYLRELL